MNHSITFTAPTGAELAAQVRDFIGALQPVGFVQAAAATPGGGAGGPATFGGKDATAVSARQVAEAIAQAAGIPGATIASAVNAGVEAPKGRPGRKPKAEPPVPAGPSPFAIPDKEVQAAADVQPKPAEPVVEAAIPTAEETKQALIDLSKKQSMKVAEAFMAKQGIAKVSDVPEGQRAAFIAAAEQAALTGVV